MARLSMTLTKSNGDSITTHFESERGAGHANGQERIVCEWNGVEQKIRYNAAGLFVLTRGRDPGEVVNYRGRVPRG